MTNEETALQLINEIPGYVTPSVDFFVQQGPSEWRQVKVPAGGEPGSAPTNPAFLNWIVYAVAGGQPTTKIKTVDPNGTFVAIIDTWTVGLASGPSGSGSSSQLTLQNQLSPTLVASADFLIQAAAGPATRVTVKSGEVGVYQTDPSQAPWTVVAVVGEMSSNKVSTSDPGATFMCQIDAWTPGLASGPSSDTQPVCPPQAPPPAGAPPIEALIGARDLPGLLRTADALAERWGAGHDDALPPIRRLAAALASLDLGDHPAQLVAADRLASLVLTHPERLSVEDEVALVHRLAEGPLPSEPPAAWPATRHRKAGQALHAWGRLEREVDHAFDFADLPPLKALPPAETGLPAGVAPEAIADPALRARHLAAIEQNRRAVEAHGRQRRLHALLDRFRPAVERFLVALYARPSYSEAELSELVGQKLGGGIDAASQAHLLGALRAAIEGAASTAPAVAIEAVVRPLHDFPGRSRGVFGVGEAVLLSHAATPALSPAQAGKLRWVVTSGGGTFESNRHGEAVFHVGGPGPAKLSLRITEGPGLGQTVATADVVGVAPAGAYMAQKPATGLYHVQDSFSVGFKGEIFLTPNNVSYEGVLFREGTVPAVAVGWLIAWNGLVHAVGVTHTITGNKVDCIDTVFSGQKAPPPPYAAGSFLWAIPWQYSLDNGTTWTTFTTANHQAASAAVGVDDGSATIQKAGAGPFTALASAAGSNY